MLTVTEYLEASTAFLKGEGVDFASLVENGVRLAGTSYRKFAHELEIMPSTVLRWAKGTSVPIPPTQKDIVAQLRRPIAKAHAAATEAEASKRASVRPSMGSSPDGGRISYPAAAAKGHS